MRAELLDKAERDTTGLESLLEGDQDNYFLSAGGGDKASGGKSSAPAVDIEVLISSYKLSSNPQVLVSGVPIHLQIIG